MSMSSGYGTTAAFNRTKIIEVCNKALKQIEDLTKEQRQEFIAQVRTYLSRKPWFRKAKPCDLADEEIAQQYWICPWGNWGGGISVLSAKAKKDMCDYFPIYMSIDYWAANPFKNRKDRLENILKMATLCSDDNLYLSEETFSFLSKYF